VVACAFSTTKGQTDQPQDEEHDGHDPQDMECESQPKENQNQKQCEQNDHEFRTPSLRIPSIRWQWCSRRPKSSNYLRNRNRPAHVLIGLGPSVVVKLTVGHVRRIWVALGLRWAVGAVLRLIRTSRIIP
jgi:hypothetical protein